MGEQILVVEDDLALASVIRFNLAAAGYSVEVAGDGCEGWQRAQAGSFDLVITDQQMPGMTGSELCRQLRSDERYAAVPIMMLTAKRLELDQRKLQAEIGVTEIFSKPFSPQELIEAVAAHLPVA